MLNILVASVSRRKLAKVIPGLRPWEVLSVEQAMDEITYGGEWYREPLGSYTTGPPYIADYNQDVMVGYNLFMYDICQVASLITKISVPAFRVLVLFFGVCVGMTVWEIF